MILLTKTPAYVFVIFFILLILGLIQLKERRAKTTRVLIMPFALILYSFYSTIATFGFNFLAVGLFSLGVILIFLFSYLIDLSKLATYNSLKEEFLIKGSFMPLVLMMLVFFAKYVLNVFQALNNPILENFLFVGASSLFFGILSGIFLVRALAILKLKIN